MTAYRIVLIDLILITQCHAVIHTTPATKTLLTSRSYSFYLPGVGPATPTPALVVGQVRAGIPNLREARYLRSPWAHGIEVRLVQHNPRRVHMVRFVYRLADWMKEHPYPAFFVLAVFFVLLPLTVIFR